MNHHGYRTWLIAFLLIGCSALNLSFLHERPTYASDTVVYIEGAEALASGNGYACGGKPQTAWPPGYSLALAPLYRLFGRSFVAYKLFNIACAGAALFCCYCLIRAVSGWGVAVLCTAAIGAYFPWIYYTHFIGADMLFTAVVSAFLLAVVRSRDLARIRRLWPAAAALMWLPLIRMAGVAMLAAWVLLICVSAVYRRDLRRSARWWLGVGAATGVSALPLMFWSLRNLRVTGAWTTVATGVTAEYAASLEEAGIHSFTLLTKLGINVRGYAHILLYPDQSRLAALQAAPWFVHGLCYAVSAVVLLGCLLALREARRRPLAIVFMCYGGMLLLHNWFDIRYLLPVLALYVLFLWHGMASIGGVLERLGARLGWRCAPLASWLPGLALAGLAAANLAISLVAPPAARLRSREYQGAAQDLFEAAQYLRSAAERGSVVVPSVGFMAIWSDRECVSVLALLDAEHRLRSRAIPHGVGYILAAGESFVGYQKYVDEILTANRERLRAVFRSGGATVYEVRDEGQPTLGVPAQ
jgi:hypothetical protein